MRRFTTTLGLCAVLMAAAPAGADTGYPFVEQITFAQTEASIMMVPDGSGPSLASAHLADGELADGTIRARLIDSNYFAIANFPAEDVWLQWYQDPGTVTGCMDYGSYFDGGVFLADVATDSDGWTEWTLPLRGGGQSTGSVSVFLNGEPAWNPDWLILPPVPLHVNSPDINGDLLINLSDITVFVSDLGTDNYRSDYNWDGIVDLTDVVMFVPAIGTVCP